MVDEFVIYDDMQYTKRDWRNRNKIKTTYGLQWITIPVEVKGKFFQKINETKVSSISWREDHWKNIQNSYSKAKYFKFYKPFFEELYLNCSETLLSKINYRFLNAICELLNINTKITWSSDYEIKGDKTEKLVNICLEANANTYFTGPAAKNYLNVDLFQKNGISVEWLDYSGYKEYEQLYPPFDHAVSIIDLILSVGPQAKNYLKSFNL